MQRFGFCRPLPFALVLILATSCSQPPRERAEAALAQQTPPPCLPGNVFSQAIDEATAAANLAQSARSPQEWDLVVRKWLQAIQGMSAIPPNSSQRLFAQKKVTEYLQNLEIAIARASASQRLSFPSFNSQFLDEQLPLYLSYVAALGTPDILIVGSSRAVQGVDPRQLQQALASRGRPGLKVYNFSINGATAQVVDVVLRRVLTPEQLPRMIVWADGVRAFNSGRPDHTYNKIVSSAGYQQVLAGNRPTLPNQDAQLPVACINSDPSSPTNSVLGSTMNLRAQLVGNWETTTLPPTQPLLLSQANRSGGLSLDANGFLPVSTRFNPALYYRRNPRVSGRYDADYQPFNLGGIQAAALSSVSGFAKSRQIPFVVVNLPLTQDYLDSVRRRYEQQFRASMQQRATQQGYIFIDLGGGRLNRNEYFADPSHINRFGAAAVSNALAADPRIPFPR